MNRGTMVSQKENIINRKNGMTVNYKTQTIKMKMNVKIMNKSQIPEMIPFFWSCTYLTTMILIDLSILSWVLGPSG